MNALDQLKQFTTVVADTGDFRQLEAYTPRGTLQDEPPTPAEVTLGEQTRWGWWSPEGPILVTDPE